MRYGVSPFVLQEYLSNFDIEQGLWDRIYFELENCFIVWRVRDTELSGKGSRTWGSSLGLLGFYCVHNAVR